MELISTRNLAIGYGKNTVQNELNLSAMEGQLICLLGINGCGKSTLLRTLSGIQRPLSGNVSIKGKNLLSMKREELACSLSLVLTDRVDVENMTVFELVSLGRFPYTNWSGTLTDADEKIINESISQVHLLHKKNSFLQQLSDGEKQRAVIAKALTQDTSLVLLDEPTAHLDLPNRIEIMMLLKRLSVNTKKCFILSTHELDLAVQMADLIWLMGLEGIQTGIPEDLMLQGVFQKAFGSETFLFDDFDGHFSVNYPKGNLSVSVFGEDVPVAWMKRALLRCGIGLDQNSDIRIEARKNMFLFYWKNEKAEFPTIKTLLDALNKKEVL